MKRWMTLCILLLAWAAQSALAAEENRGRWIGEDTLCLCVDSGVIVQRAMDLSGEGKQADCELTYYESESGRLREAWHREIEALRGLYASYALEADDGFLLCGLDVRREENGCFRGMAYMLNRDGTLRWIYRPEGQARNGVLTHPTQVNGRLIVGGSQLTEEALGMGEIPAECAALEPVLLALDPQTGESEDIACRLPDGIQAITDICWQKDSLILEAYGGQGAVTLISQDGLETIDVKEW